MPVEVVRMLDGAGGPVAVDDLVAEAAEADREAARAAVDLLVEHGVLVPEDVEAPPKPVWEHWGRLTERFHLTTRDADYLSAGTPERDRVAAEITADGEPPPIFKEYPDRPLLMLPRTPLPLRTSVEDVFAARRTHRVFTDDPVSLDQLSTVLLHTFGPQRFIDGKAFGVQQCRVSASAGGRHEVECYVVAHDVTGVPPGLYHYSPRLHALESLSGAVDREVVAGLVFNQPPSYQGAFTIFTTAVARRLSWKYRHPRAYRLWMLDAGHYGQTFALTCTALGLGPFQTVAFVDSAVEELLGVDPNEEFAVYLLSAGVPEGGPARLPSDFLSPPVGIVR